MPASLIVEWLKQARITIVASLPDRSLGELIARLDADPDITHMHLAREDDGVGVCAGAYLGGWRAALVCQNARVLLSPHALPGHGRRWRRVPFSCGGWRRGREARRARREDGVPAGRAQLGCFRSPTGRPAPFATGV